jgi:histidinol-phosphate aminotransferase
MVFDLDKLVRENIRELVPYSSARGEFNGYAEIFLDANENSFGSPLTANYNRYPDPQQSLVKERVAELNGVRPSEIFIGNGSDEAIDLLFRIFCRPRIDNVLICPPTYGVYKVSAAINDAAVRCANLTEDFQLDTNAVRSTVNEETKLIFLCSPNNPTGNCLDRGTVLELAVNFPGILVVDEAYIQFSDEESLISAINRFPNLVVLQTFSKAWGLAGLRLGMAIANRPIIELFNKVKAPYNVSQFAQGSLLQALVNLEQMHSTVKEIVSERNALSDRLNSISCVQRVYPSDANFILVKFKRATDVYRFLLDEKIVVRNRNNVEMCESCLRITVGTPSENNVLLRALEEYETSFVYRSRWNVDRRTRRFSG